MDFAQASLLLKNPAARLLRADQAAFALAFLHTAFKENAQTAIPAELLASRLERWLAERRQEESFEWERPARAYLEDWCAEERAWVRKVQAVDDLEPAYELTSATEKALTWLESLRGQSFVGTESRLEGILRELEELLRQTSDDPQERLSYLRTERARLDDEIARLLAGEKPLTFEPWQVNERYARVLEDARTLVSDFRQVEENFRRLAQEVVERQTTAGSTKGEIVGRVLDSHDSVRESPQGSSFYGFVRLLLDPARRERFEEQAERVRQIPALSPELRDELLLSRLFPRLRAEQEKVGASTQRLTANLRRALETARLNERRRVRDLITEIRALALRLKEDPPRCQDFFGVEELPEVWAGLSRPLWDEGPTVSLGAGLTAATIDEDLSDFARLSNLPLLTLEALRANVESCLEGRDFVLLTEVLERFPVQQGVLEVLGYLILAERAPHYLASDQLDEIALGDGTRWNIPLVMFCRAPDAVALV